MPEGDWVRVMWFKVTFNNISVIMVVSFIGGAGGGRVPGENHRPVPNY